MLWNIIDSENGFAVGSDLGSGVRLDLKSDLGLGEKTVKPRRMDR